MSKSKRLSTAPKLWSTGLILTLFITLLPFSIGSGGGNAGTPLGTWTNFPCGGTNCNCPSFGVDACQLMNNPQYLGIYSISTDSVRGDAAGLQAGFQVSCVQPATPTTGGSVLYLQYANYSLTSYLNTSNFLTIGSSIYVDNTNGWPCPGILQNDMAGTLPSLTNDLNTHGFIFRIIGVCGCSGIGNAGTLRITNVNVIVYQRLTATFHIRLASRTTTKFIYLIYASLPAPVASVITNDWIATNETSASCSLLSDVCIQSGTSSCTIPVGGFSCPSTTVNFAVTFSTAPAVVMTLTNVAPWTLPIQVSSINVFATPLVTA